MNIIINLGFSSSFRVSIIVKTSKADHQKFLEIPGFTHVRSVSDDPEHFEQLKDLFDLQSDGLSAASYGKKDKATTKQVFFKCLPCDCD